MSEVKFEGDIKQISERQLQYIGSVVKERGFGDAKVIIEPVGKAGDNYVANVKRIVIEKDGEIFKMIAKIAPTIEMLRKATNLDALFHNEYVLYTDVLVKFVELERAAEIPENERLRIAACYGCLMDPPHEVILLEDLSVAGFIMLDRFKTLTNDEIKLVLKDFAKLHSLSYALKYREPDTFSDIKNKLFHLGKMFSFAEEMSVYFAQIEAQVMTGLEDEKYKSVVKGTVSQMALNMVKLYEMDCETRYSIIQHGDAWTNNIMFRIKEDKPEQCCMIDYQQSRINTPVGDLLYFLFNCTDQETRSKNFYDWIDFYHTQLDKSLSNFGLKANFYYPRDQLDADLKRHGKVSLGQSILMCSILLGSSEDAAKMKEAMENDVSLSDITELLKSAATKQESMFMYKARVEGLIQSHLDLGFV